MVTSAIIAVALGRPAPVNGSLLDLQWTMWIQDAQRLVASRAEKLGKVYASLPPDDLDYVIREAVVAHARNPDGTKTVDVRIDDGSLARTYSAQASQRVEISDDLWDELGLSESGTAFTITPYGARSTWWCS